MPDKLLSTTFRPRLGLDRVVSTINRPFAVLDKVVSTTLQGRLGLDEVQAEGGLPFRLIVGSYSVIYLLLIHFLVRRIIF